MVFEILNLYDNTVAKIIKSLDYRFIYSIGELEGCQGLVGQFYFTFI